MLGGFFEGSFFSGRDFLTVFYLKVTVGGTEPIIAAKQHTSVSTALSVGLAGAPAWLCLSGVPISGCCGAELLSRQRQEQALLTARCFLAKGGWLRALPRVLQQGRPCEGGQHCQGWFRRGHGWGEGNPEEPAEGNGAWAGPDQAAACGGGM